MTKKKPSKRSKVSAKSNHIPLEDCEDELPDIGVEYDFVHLFGTEAEIEEYESDSCVVVDWRGEETLDEISEAIGDDELQWAETKRGFGMTVAYGSKTASAREKEIKAAGFNVVLIQLINKVLKPDYEIRIMRESMGGDTWSLLVKPRAWWKAMDKHFAARTSEFCATIDDWLQE